MHHCLKDMLVLNMGLGLGIAVFLNSSFGRSTTDQQNTGLETQTSAFYDPDSTLLASKYKCEPLRVNAAAEPPMDHAACTQLFRVRVKALFCMKASIPSSSWATFCTFSHNKMLFILLVRLWSSHWWCNQYSSFFFLYQVKGLTVCVPHVQCLYNYRLHVITDEGAHARTHTASA